MNKEFITLESLGINIGKSGVSRVNSNYVRKIREALDGGKVVIIDKLAPSKLLEAKKTGKLDPSIELIEWEKTGLTAKNKYNGIRQQVVGRHPQSVCFGMGEIVTKPISDNKVLIGLVKTESE